MKQHDSPPSLLNGLLDFSFVDNARAIALLDRLRALAPIFSERSPEHDRLRRFPAENFVDLHREGLMALQVPAEFGGAGLSPLEYIAALAILASGDAATALAYNMHSTAMVSLASLASEEQKKRWFERVVKDGIRVAALGSERDLKPFVDGAPPRTRLTRTSEGYKLSGQKNYCTFGGDADLLYVVAAMDEGIGFAMVDGNAPGVSRRDDWHVMAMRSTASVTTDFDEVSIAPGDVIVPSHAAMVMMLEIEFALGYGPIYLATAAVASAHTIGHLQKSLSPFLATPDGRLHPDVGLAFMGVGEICTKLAPAWLLCRQAAQTLPVGTFARAAAIVAAKAVACDTACDVAELALRLSGGRALAEQSPIGRAFRDVQAGQAMAFSPAQARFMIGRLALGFAPEYMANLHPG